MKKNILLAVNLILLVVITITIVVLFKDKVQNENVFIDNSSEKLTIITTLFPEYDFTKQIVGDKANVKLIIKPGVETHNFEPTAQDIILVNKADMFVTLGYDLEPWVKDVASSINDKDKILDLSKNINIIAQDEFEEGHENHKEHHEHEESHDSHVWLSMSNSKIMINDILNEIILLDEENKEYYIQNANEYLNEIDKLDREYKEFVKENKDLVYAFGGEFAYSYLMHEYDLSFVSVYTNCGHGEDPSIARVKDVIDVINDKEIPVVFYEELSEGMVAKMIAEETDAESLVLYTLHNGNIDGENKDTYVSLMRKNLDNLKKCKK